MQATVHRYSADRLCCVSILKSSVRERESARERESLAQVCNRQRQNLEVNYNTVRENTVPLDGLEGIILKYKNRGTKLPKDKLL